MGDKVKYPLTRETEMAMAAAMCTSTRYYQMVGHSMDPDRMLCPEAALLVWGARRVAQERSGEGCVSIDLALQEVRSAHSAGQIDRAVYDKLLDYTDEIIQRGIPDAEVLIAQSVPMVMYGRVQEVMDDLLRGLAGTSPMNGPKIAELASDTAYRMQKAADIGRRPSAKVSAGTGDIAAVQRIIAQSAFGGYLMPTGIPELDKALGGGVESKTFNLVIAGTGAGKTGYLCHQFVEALIQGFAGIYFTFELDVAEIESKIYRDLVGMTRYEFSQMPQEVVRRFKLLRDTGLAPFWVVKMPPGTPLRAVLREVNNIRRENGNPDIKMVVLDYIDKMKGDGMSSWEEVEHMADAVREQLAITLDGWVWSGSQKVKGQSSNGEEPITVDHARGGAGKTHGCDLALGLRRTLEDMQTDSVRFDIAKRRIGPGEGIPVGPLLRDVERGRIVMTTRPTPWDHEHDGMGLDITDAPAEDLMADAVQVEVLCESQK